MAQSKILEKLYTELSWCRQRIANQIVIESGLLEYLKEKRLAVLCGNGTYLIGKKQLNFKDWNKREFSKQWIIVHNKIVELLDGDEFKNVYQVLSENSYTNY